MLARSLPVANALCKHVVLPETGTCPETPDDQPDRLAEVWAVAKTGPRLGEWVIQNKSSRQSVAELLLQGDPVAKLSCIVLPGTTGVHWKELGQARKQSLFPMEFLAPEATLSTSAPFPVKKITEAGLREYLTKALHESRGEHIWIVDPADRPDPNLPAALLAGFAREDIDCVRSYAPAGKDCIRQNLGKHTCTMSGNMLLQLAHISGRRGLYSPTIAVFKREKLLTVLPHVHGNGQDFLDKLFEAVHKDAGVAIVPSCLLLP